MSDPADIIPPPPGEGGSYVFDPKTGKTKCVEQGGHAPEAPPVTVQIDTPIADAPEAPAAIIETVVADEQAATDPTPTPRRRKEP